MLFWLHIMFVTSTIPGTPMPYIPSVGNELSTTRAPAYPPIFTPGWTPPSTVIPVVLIVLPIIKTSRGSFMLNPFPVGQAMDTLGKGLIALST